MARPRKENPENFVNRTYALPAELVKAITLKTAEGDMNKNEVVQAALEAYLADILVKIRKEGDI